MEMLSPRRADLPRSRHGRPLTEEVQRTLRVKLIRDTCTAAMTASLYAVSRRTLYRHLKAEGGTFRQVANGVRCEIACTLLAETNLTLSQITEILNYSEIGAFSRAFRRWAGQPPSVWRSSHRARKKGPRPVL
jgi:AraC-like DNA-binding protein